MMAASAEGELASGPVLDLAAMAAIVRDMCDGVPDRRGDSLWLRRRIEAAGLDVRARQALEALHARLVDGGTVFATLRDVLKW